MSETLAVEALDLIAAALRSALLSRRKLRLGRWLSGPMSELSHHLLVLLLHGQHHLHQLTCCRRAVGRLKLEIAVDAVELVLPAHYVRRLVVQVFAQTDSLSERARLVRLQPLGSAWFGTVGEEAEAELVEVRRRSVGAHLCRDGVASHTATEHGARLVGRLLEVSQLVDWSKLLAAFGLERLERLERRVEVLVFKGEHYRTCLACQACEQQVDPGVLDVVVDVTVAVVLLALGYAKTRRSSQILNRLNKRKSHAAQSALVGFLVLRWRLATSSSRPSMNHRSSADHCSRCRTRTRGNRLIPRLEARCASTTCRGCEATKSWLLSKSSSSSHAHSSSRANAIESVALYIRIIAYTIHSDCNEPS